MGRCPTTLKKKGKKENSSFFGKNGPNDFMFWKLLRLASNSVPGESPLRSIIYDNYPKVYRRHILELQLPNAQQVVLPIKEKVLQFVDKYSFLDDVGGKLKQDGHHEQQQPKPTRHSGAVDSVV